MDDVNALRLAFENQAVGAKCALNHTGDPDPQPPIDHIEIGIGKTEGSVTHIVGSFTIPLCPDCHDSLIDNDRWLLIYCFECHASVWIDKWLAKGTYGPIYNLMLVGGCKECAPGVKSKYTYFLKIDPTMTGGIENG